MKKKQKGAEKEIQTEHNITTIKSRPGDTKLNTYHTGIGALSITYLNNKRQSELGIRNSHKYLKTIYKNITMRTCPHSECNMQYDRNLQIRDNAKWRLLR